MCVPPPKILSPEESTRWRRAFIDAFVDVKSDYFRTYLAPRPCSDGDHYIGYLWDCLRSRTRISSRELRERVGTYSNVFVMADDHSRDHKINTLMWPYAPRSVASFQSKHLVHGFKSLPDDLYIFDSSLSWTLVLTHESDDNTKKRKSLQQRRWCWSADATIRG